MSDFLKSTSAAEAAALERNLLSILTSYSEEILSVKSEVSPCRPAPWLSGPLLKNSMKNLKEYSKLVNETCTKIGVITIPSLKGEVRDSIYEELGGRAKDVFLVFRSIVEGNEFCYPLLESLCICTRGFIHQVSVLVKTINLGEATSLNSTVGMIWKANKRMQELPESNKAAYRRMMLEELSVIDETSKEFQEYLENSLSGTGSGETRDEEYDDEDDDGMCSYTAEEIPIVQQALAVIGDQKQAVKSVLYCMGEIAEKVSSSATESCDVKSACYAWIADIVHTSRRMKPSVIDLGAELYHPVDSCSVNTLCENNRLVLIELVSKLTRPPFDISAVTRDWSETYLKEIDTINRLLTP